MAMYAVYSPALGADVAGAFDRTRALKQGFARWGFVFGPLWLLVNRLWLALAFWIFGAAVLELGSHAGWISPAAAGAVYWLSALAIGFEGREWQGYLLTSSGRPLADVVEARNSDEAEAKFLARALGDVPVPAPPPGDRPRQAPPRSNTQFPIIGLFPESSR